MRYRGILRGAVAGINPNQAGHPSRDVFDLPSCISKGRAADANAGLTARLSFLATMAPFTRLPRILFQMGRVIWLDAKLRSQPRQDEPVVF